MRAIDVMPGWVRPAEGAAGHVSRADSRPPAAPAHAGGVPTGATDRELVTATVAGNPAAFDVLVERHQRAVYRACYRIAGRHEDAADLAQDTFLRAYRALSRFRGEASFSTWLYRIAVNVSLSHVGGPDRSCDTAFDFETTPDERTPSAVEALASGERRRRLRKAVARLPRRQRETLVLRVYHDLSYEEIAATLNRSVGTVKANVFFAIRKLRAMLRDENQRV